MTGTSAFESIVPSIVATSRLSVRSRAIVGGTRATFKRISRHDSPNAADLQPSPERLRRRRDSMSRAHSTRRRDDRTRPRPDDGGQGTDCAPLEHPLEAPGQGSRRLRSATQAEVDVARTAAAVCRRRTSEHRRDPRPQPPRAIPIRPRRVLGNGRGPEEGAEDRGHQGRRDRAAIELALRGRSETLRCRNVRRRELTVNVWSISYSMSYTTAD